MCNSPKKFIPQEQRSHKKSEQQSITSDFKHKTNIFLSAQNCSGPCSKL